MMHSPSKLARDASKAPVTAPPPIPEASHCTLCAAELPAGSPALPWSPGASFNNWGDLQPTTHICQDCIPLLKGSTFLQQYAKGVVSQGRWYRFHTNNEIAYWALNPPEPPFIMFFGTAKMHHIIWRTPVSLSRELFQIRFGEQVFVIRHALLTVAHEAALAFIEAAQQKGSTTAASTLLFRYPARDLDGVDALAWQPAALADPAHGHLFRSLNLGERWLLACIQRATDLTTPPQRLDVVIPQR